MSNLKRAAGGFETRILGALSRVAESGKRWGQPDTLPYFVTLLKPLGEAHDGPAIRGFLGADRAAAAGTWYLVLEESES